MSEVEALQPWQIFCSMFAIFWLFSAWCDQVLITLLLCIVFGVLSDVITKSMYSSPSQEEKAERQASAEEKKESNEKIWQAAEAQLEEEEGEEGGVPPPLPAKDYTTNTTAHSIHSLADKLQALVDTDEAAVQEEEEQEEQEEGDTQPRQYNRTVSDEYNQNTSAVNYNSREGVIAEEGLGQETNDDDDEDEDDDSEEEDGKIYAKDSSDEEDYDYASREVNFNESESATEEEDEVNDENDGGGGDPTKKSVTNTQKNLKDDE